MFGRKSNGDKHIASLVGAGSTFVGDLTFAGGLRIDGTVRGSVRCVGGEGSGMLVISEKGVVEGEVRAAHLVVAGSITGPVYTTEMVELQPKARIVGDVHYRALEIHHGAVVEGRLMHESGAQDGKGGLKLAVAAPVAPPKTQSAAG
jgi:cytoskeletal protein CcmA (bactofilin family)